MVASNICMTCSLYFMLFSYLFMLSLPLHGCVAVNSEGKSALIVSVMNQHYDTTAFFAYQFHQLGYHITLWLNSEAQANPYAMHSGLLEQWAEKIVYLPSDKKNISTVDIPTDPYTVLVYINMNTFEETKYLCSPDTSASKKDKKKINKKAVSFDATTGLEIQMAGEKEADPKTSLTNKLHEKLFDLAQSVLMVSHSTKNILSLYKFFCAPPKCTLFVPSPFLQQASLALFMKEGHEDAQVVQSVPVYPLPLPQESDASSNSRTAVILPADIALEFAAFTEQTRFVVFFGEVDKNKRKLEKLLRCAAVMRERHGLDLRVFILPSRPPNRALATPHTPASLNPLSLPPRLTQFVRVVEGLTPPQIKVIFRKAEFLLTFDLDIKGMDSPAGGGAGGGAVGGAEMRTGEGGRGRRREKRRSTLSEEDGSLEDKGGLTHGLAHLSALSQNVRAPSILPLSLLTSTPLLLPSHILHVSPSCMRSANIFNSVARGDLCNSLTLALNLTMEERKGWKREVRMCRGVLSREGTGVIQGAISHTLHNLNQYQLEEEQKKQADDDDDDGHRKCCRCRVRGGGATGGGY